MKVAGAGAGAGVTVAAGVPAGVPAGVAAGVAAGGVGVVTGRVVVDMDVIFVIPRCRRARKKPAMDNTSSPPITLQIIGTIGTLCGVALDEDDG